MYHQPFGRTLYKRVLQGIPNYRKNHLAIMDDILTHSKRVDHIGHLIDLFKAIMRNGLKISPRKCKLFKELVFMGNNHLGRRRNAKDETS